MKAAMAQKPPETAFLGALVFSARMSAKAAGRKIATAFRRFAKTTGGADGCRVTSGGCPEEKQPFSAIGRLSSVLRLRWYSLRLRFKRCSLTPDSRSLNPECRANPAKGFGWPEEKCGRMAV